MDMTAAAAAAARAAAAVVAVGSEHGRATTLTWRETRP